MQDVPIPPELAHDPQGKRHPGYGRNPERTLMQWTGGPHADFCPANAQPWLPLAADSGEIDVLAQREDVYSMLTLTRALLALRRAKPALSAGGYHALDGRAEHCLVYLREDGQQRLLVALNFSAEFQMVRLPELGEGRVLLSTALDREGQIPLAALSLRSHEGCIIDLAPALASW